jgi:catechol 2,3-dioxygenase-like lactoylglutathione lyase family enzyme
MIPYSTVGTSDMERAVGFYDAVFGALGGSPAPNWSGEWSFAVVAIHWRPTT